MDLRPPITFEYEYFAWWTRNVSILIYVCYTSISLKECYVDRRMKYRRNSESSASVWRCQSLYRWHCSTCFRLQHSSPKTSGFLHIRNSFWVSVQEINYQKSISPHRTWKSFALTNLPSADIEALVQTDEELNNFERKDETPVHCCDILQRLGKWSRETDLCCSTWSSHNGRLPLVINCTTKIIRIWNRKRIWILFVYRWNPTYWCQYQRQSKSLWNRQLFIAIDRDL